MTTISDAERAFYLSVLADTDDKTINDLRYAYYLAGLDGALPTNESRGRSTATHSTRAARLSRWWPTLP